MEGDPLHPPPQIAALPSDFDSFVIVTASRPREEAESFSLGLRIAAIECEPLDLIMLVIRERFGFMLLRPKTGANIGNGSIM